ncbi:MAG: hypothetical protein DWQ04_05560 [Chloroflexi bacterium]|nr:MAG: hypothetical protein DWQ04_05560 [Chloroflexota bacterium]
MEEYKQIFLTSDSSAAEKISQAFDYVTSKIIVYSEQEIELLKAMNDREMLIKEQIKLSTVKHCRSIFSDAYQQATGRKAWDE